MRSSKLSALALSGALAFSLAACGDSDEDTGTEAAAAAEPTVVEDIPGRITELTLDQAFLDGVTGLGLTPGLVGDSTLDGNVLGFPISGGNVTLYEYQSRDPFVEGEINHDGQGLTLTGGGIEVTLQNFDIDPGASVLTGDVLVDGEEAAADAPLFFLDGSTLQPYISEGEDTILQGTTVSLTAEAADLLNTTFGVDALMEFFPVGVARITVGPPAA